MKKLILIVLVAVMTLSLVACANGEEAPEGMMDVAPDNEKYNFYVPQNWRTNSGDIVGAYYSMTDRSNVSVMGYVPTEDSYSVADYWEYTEKHYKDTLKDYTLTAEPAEATMGGKRATVYEYTYSLSGVTYKCRQTVCVYSYMIVIMTYTALPENYDAHMEDVQAMQDALTFRTPVFG